MAIGKLECPEASGHAFGESEDFALDVMALVNFVVVGCGFSRSRVVVQSL